MSGKKNLILAALSLAAISAFTAAQGAPATGGKDHPARYANCLHLSMDYKNLEQKTHADPHSTAHKIAHQADQFCRMGRYQKGVTLYQKALKKISQP